SDGKRVHRVHPARLFAMLRLPGSRASRRDNVMIRLSSRAAALILAAALSIGGSDLAVAATKQASIVAESTPAANATVTATEMTIDIRFTTKIDPHHSRLVLLL